MKIDRCGRVHRADGQYEPVYYDTARGPMTRREIAKAAGVPINTIHSRLFQGITGENLFAPANGFKPRKPRGRSGEYGKYQRRSPRRNSHDDAAYIETWADRKKRLARERENAD